MEATNKTPAQIFSEKNFGEHIKMKHWGDKVYAIVGRPCIISELRPEQREHYKEYVWCTLKVPDLKDRQVAYRITPWAMHPMELVRKRRNLFLKIKVKASVNIRKQRDYFYDSSGQIIQDRDGNFVFYPRNTYHAQSASASGDGWYWSSVPSE